MEKNKQMVGNLKHVSNTDLLSYYQTPKILVVEIIIVNRFN